MDEKSYYSAYSLLVKEYLALLEYIEPTDKNKSVYSHRLYELYLRACTEFENICKEILLSENYEKTGHLNINDYRTLDASLKLNEREVGLLFWQPYTKYISPFSDWKIADKPLSWYQDYNKVKHNRNTEFSRASLLNVTSAIAAVFTILFCKFGVAFFNPYDVMSASKHKSSTSGSRITIVNNSIFNIRWSVC
jgi:hypothetical protein